MDPRELMESSMEFLQNSTTSSLALAAAGVLTVLLCISYLCVYLVAPTPRKPLESEKLFACVDNNGRVDKKQKLPCWQDNWYAHKNAIHEEGDPSATGVGIEGPEVFVSLVVPAYNEEERLEIMLVEAIEYLQDQFSATTEGEKGKGGLKHREGHGNGTANGHASSRQQASSGWEILVVSDGSTDGTVDTAFRCAKSLDSKAASSIRVIELAHNRGKGGAVTHGMRHVRGKYAIFADADGASKFEDLGKLLQECKKVEDSEGRGVAVGSRAHLVGSEAVVKRSFVRNFLMHSFHLLLRLLTPPATAAIRDTQCGFKLFSRPALPYIIPYMHTEGWIFDVEMLMLAESASIPVAEVPIGWHEVKGSKLNVIWDSLAMAWGLAILRTAWSIGIYRRS